MVQYLAAFVLTALVGYLLGGVVFGVLISKVFYHDDVRTHGSGNAGMTNMLRNYGKGAAAATAVGDVGKSVAVVFLGRAIMAALLPNSPLDPVCGAYLAGIFAVIGHCKPVFFGFKGGKGVLVGAGSALATEPLVCLGLLAIFLVEVSITRIVSLGSIIIAGLYPVVTVCYLAWQGANLPTLAVSGLCTAVMGVMVIWMHRSNIQRLRDGTEYRFGQKK